MPASGTAPTLLLDGRQGLTGELGQGFFINPTLFDKVTTEMSIYQRRDLRPGVVRGARADLCRGRGSDQPQQHSPTVSPVSRATAALRRHSYRKSKSA
jgi:hypothetical protein